MQKNSNLDAYWSKTRNHMFVVLGFWFFFAYFIHFFVTDLNQWLFMGFPLGYYFAAQGSLFAFVIIIFWFAWKQNKIDEDFGMNEE